jgi:O-antigen/teichoic acid export membrane protein
LTARAFLEDALGVVLSQYLARVVVLARGLVAAVALGPGGFGAWNALNLILDYGAYASLGAFQGLDLELPARAARGDAAGATRAMRAAGWVALAGGGAFTLGVVAFLAAGSWVESTGWGMGAPALMMAATLVQLAIHHHVSALRAQGAFGPASAGLALQAALGGGLGLATVWSVGVWGLLWGWLAGGLAGLLWMRRSPLRPPLLPGHPALGAALVRAGLPISAFFVAMLVLRSLDRIALVRFGGNEALGLYSLGLIAAGVVLQVPEAAAAVLFPRVAAAAAGARDRERVRGQVLRAQRALTALLPLAVGVALPWAAPLVAALLPAYVPGLGALTALSVGALLLSAATLPSYYLLASGEGRRLAAAAATAALLTGVLVFAAASRSPTPGVVAWAAVAGYATVALALLGRAALRLLDRGAERARFLAASLLPALYAAGLLLLLARGDALSAGGAAWRTALFVLAYAPALAWLRRSSDAPLGPR